MDFCDFTLFVELYNVVYSWFVCFAPRENPKIAVAVVVENAGFGATWAGPMASLMVEKYLKDTLSQARWKEVERIESKEIILPIVKAKRRALDSLRLQRLRNKQLRKQAFVPLSPFDEKNHERIILAFHLNALKPDHEEQFI